MNESQVNDVDIAFPGLEPLWRLALGGIYEMMYQIILAEEENLFIEAQPEFGKYLMGEEPQQLNAMRAAYALIGSSMRAVASVEGVDWKTGKLHG